MYVLTWLDQLIILTIRRTKMEKSESISNILSALSLAQGQIKGAKLDGTNDYYKSKYVSLGSIFESCREPFFDNCLCVIQTIEDAEIGFVKIRTMIGHASGEWIAGTCSMPTTIKDGMINAHTIGSAITYARRYGLSAMIGSYDYDDDGENAVGRTTGRDKSEGAHTEWAHTEGAHTEGTHTEGAHTEGQCISIQQSKRFYAIAKKNVRSDEEIKNYVKSLGFEHTSMIPRTLYDEACVWASQPFAM